MESFRELVASREWTLKITALKAVQVESCTQTIVKVETDAGIIGYGEAGGPGPMIRGNLKYFERFLLGQDALEIDKLYNTMINLQHPNRPHIPTASAIDIALWDIAGKVMGRPVSQLLRGQYRDWVPLYVNSRGPSDWLDKGACREWAAEFQAHPNGWRAVKMGFRGLLGQHLPRDLFVAGRRSTMLRVSDIKVIAQGYANIREALDPSIDIIVHCHNEFDLPSALGLARALADVQPLWIEDALPVPYSHSWAELKRQSPVNILTGEKLELPIEFLPFMANGAVHMMQPDILFAGGFSGCWKIADLAEMHYIPITTHNVGTVVQNAVSALFGASTRNFAMSETRLGAGPVLDEIIEEELVVKDSRLRVPDGPGLGITINEEALRDHLAPGEPWWDEA